MNPLSQHIEAILYIAGEPVLLSSLATALEVSEEEVSNTISQMQDEFERSQRGLIIRQYGQFVRIETHPDCAPYIERLLQPIQKQSLSQTAMETLAVIAYNQPTTKGEVELIRGIKCDYSVQSLLQKKLIMEVGRKDVLGRPILYGTTDEFLAHFGISDLRELPPLPPPVPLTSTEPPLVP